MRLHWAGPLVLAAMSLSACGARDEGKGELPDAAVADGTVASTTYGPVRGAKAENGAFVFKGVPYAGSTAGEHRFMPPTAPAIWETPRDATQFGARCPQIPPPVTPAYASWATDLPIGEDCL